MNGCDLTEVRKRNKNNNESGDLKSLNGSGDEKNQLGMGDKVPRKPRNSWDNYADLSSFETYFYIFCSVTSIFYSCYRVLKLSPTAFKMFVRKTEFFHGADPLFIKPTGYLSWAGPAKDDTQTEWYMHCWHLAKAWPWLLCHVFLSATLRRLNFSGRNRMSILGILAAFAICKVSTVSVLISQLSFAAIGLLAARVTKNILVVWCWTIVCLVTLNYPDGVPYLGVSAFRFVFDQNNYDYLHYYLWVVSLALVFNKTVSYCHEKIKSDFKYQGEDVSFIILLIDLFNFVCYLPLWFSGPAMIYTEFERDVRITQQPHLKLCFDKENLKFVGKSLLKLIRLLFWALITELILYRMYFGVMMTKHLFLWESVDLWELAGIGYCSGIFFYLKYLQLYGFNSLIAHIDGMDAPAQPKCITRIYLYSDMWKYFDTGLYNFMKHHVYIPLGGSQKGFIRQLSASFLSFLFIWFWHGSEFYIMYWIALNFTTIILENVGRNFQKSHPEIEGSMSPQMWRRLRIFLATPPYIASTVGIFMFIGSHEEIGKIYFTRFFVDGLFTGGLLVTFCMYCIAQTSVTCFKREERLMNLKHDATSKDH